MKNNWKDFVQFSSSERRGIITLCVIAIICAAYSYFAPKWVSNRQIADFEEKYAEALQKARNYNDSIASFSKLKYANFNDEDEAQHSVNNQIETAQKIQSVKPSKNI
ncbi:MAG: hypothetical protein R2728_06665 [Chitinophagales bacterium]